MAKTCDCIESGWWVTRLRVHGSLDGAFASKQLETIEHLLQERKISTFLVMGGFASRKTSCRPLCWPKRWQEHQGITSGWHVFLCYFSLNGWDNFPYGSLQMRCHKSKFVRTIDEAQQCANKWLAYALNYETIMASFRDNCFVLKKSGTVDSEAGRLYEEFVQQHEGFPIQDDTREYECRQHPEGESLPEELGSSRLL